MDIYLCLMSEYKKILFISDNVADLTSVIWTLLGFMYPFEWKRPAIPVLFNISPDSKEI
jgi:hypothetical protein